MKRIRRILKLYSVKEMTDFGNYMLEKHKLDEKVWHSDWCNWIEKRK